MYAFVSLNLVLLCFLGIYAFANPDKEAYLVDTYDRGEILVGTLEEAKALDNGYYDRVHDDLVRWFIVVFIAQIAYLMTVLLVLYQHKYPGLNCLIGFPTTIFLIVCALTVFFDMPDYLRKSCGDYEYAPYGMTEDEWRDEITSPDSLYQVSTCRFMRYYSIVILSIAGVFITTSCCAFHYKASDVAQSMTQSA